MPPPEEQPQRPSTGSGRASVRNQRTGASWLQPSVEPPILQRYVQVLRERWVIVLVCLVGAVAGVSIYLATAESVYEAQADLLVNPISRDDATYVGLGLIRESNDPTRDVETVARLMRSTAVARRARDVLGTDRSPQALLSDIQADPVANSNIVAITAHGASPGETQRVANAFGNAIVAERTQQLAERVDAALARIRARAESSAPELSAARDALEVQIATLETLRGAPDPTVRLENPAEPGSQIAPRPLLAGASAVVVGLVLGVVVAFLLDMLDPRLRREEQLRRIVRLPVLARIPKQRHDSGPLRPEALSAGTIEAFRTLRATLAASRSRDAASVAATLAGLPPVRDAEARSILVTGASASEGKTTTAINLAASLAFAGHQVILVEADLRRPSIGKALGVGSRRGLMDVILQKAALEDVLARSDAYGPNLELLLAADAGDAGGASADGLFLPTALGLIDAAKRLAEFVVIDSPPLTEVIDGLALAEHADEVLIVVRLGKSQRSRIVQLGELLAHQGIEPVGFAVIGVPTSASASDYYVPPEPRLRALARP
jgi:succinoglycan biosynthesis transport protein ExoP